MTAMMRIEMQMKDHGSDNPRFRVYKIVKLAVFFYFTVLCVLCVCGSMWRM